MLYKAYTFMDLHWLQPALSSVHKLCFLACILTVLCMDGQCSFRQRSRFAQSIACVDKCLWHEELSSPFYWEVLIWRGSRLEGPIWAKSPLMPFGFVMLGFFFLSPNLRYLRRVATWEKLMSKFKYERFKNLKAAFIEILWSVFYHSFA